MRVVSGFATSRSGEARQVQEPRHYVQGFGGVALLEMLLRTATMANDLAGVGALANEIDQGQSSRSCRNFSVVYLFSSPPKKSLRPVQMGGSVASLSSRLAVGRTPSVDGDTCSLSPWWRE